MPASIEIAIKQLSHAKGLPLPAYQTLGSAGMDLAAALEEPVKIEPAAIVRIPTGLAIALPDTHEAQIRPRSGLAAKHGLTVLNSPGTIDADYRGEIQVILINHGASAFSVERGMRIAQMVIAPVQQARFVEVAVLPESQRGAGGFGSTGHAENPRRGQGQGAGEG